MEKNVARINSLRLNGKVVSRQIHSKDIDSILEDTEVIKGLAPEMTASTTFFFGLELMGLALPSVTFNTYGSGMVMQAATKTGEQITDNAKNMLMPKQLLTKGSFTNAVSALLALGGSVAGLDLLSQLVMATDNKIHHGFFYEITQKVPQLAMGHKKNIYALLKHLNDNTRLIEDNVPTFDGVRLRVKLANTEPERFDTINTPRLTMVKGGACEDGGYVQPTANTPISISGRAWVYKSLEDADNALSTGAVTDGIVVVQNCVGMDISAVIHTIEGMGKEREIAVATDGLACMTEVMVVQLCRPSALQNEDFANIQMGDHLEIDLAKGRFNTSVLSKDMKHRARRGSVQEVPTFFC
jgi:dihydroxy-acid dehydratase